MIKNRIKILPVHNGVMPFTFDDKGNFYNIEEKEISAEELINMDLDDFKKIRNLVVYNPSLERINTIPLVEMDDHIRKIHNISMPNENPRFLFLQGDDIIITTDYNRCYTINPKGEIINFLGTEEKNDHNFFSSFFRISSGEVICITKGKKDRNRYILAISMEALPSFHSTSEFETSYLQDCWIYNELIEGNENKELFPNKMKFLNGEDKIKLLTFIEQRENDLKDSWDLNLGSRFIPNNLQLLQAFELSNNRILLSAFTDSESKSSYPDKHTLYFFFILDKFTGEVLDEIAPYDTSIYKNVNYLIAEDKINSRFLFKSEKALYQISKDGVLSQLISLKGRNYAKFRKLNLVGNTGEHTYFHYRNKSDYNNYEMLAIKLGNSASEINENILEFSKNWKEPS
ncbi:MAG: hypothetical protein MK078_12700 [Crocinitomicaceae bacterium]|nr:hypothetical protein [Crocinitomicaceae bacterium]